MGDEGGKPIINAGDGANQHPTQTLLDLYSIQKTQGTLENLNIFMVGDLKYGRTVHSLVDALSHFGAHMFFIAPPELKMPESQLKELDDRGIAYVEEEDLEKVSANLDVLYCSVSFSVSFFLWWPFLICF